MDNFTYDKSKSWADMQEEEEQQLENEKKNLNNGNVHPTKCTHERNPKSFKQ